MVGDIRLERALAIEGWMSPTELKWLAETAKKSKQILEIGSYKGRSTRALCDNTDGIVIAVDPWDGPYIKDDGGTLFDQAKSSVDFGKNLADVENLIIFQQYFQDFVKPKNAEEFDFIFIDGDHRYSQVMHDINKSLGLLKPGGIISGHDYRHKDWPGVKQAVDEVFPNARKIDSIWWTQKS